MGTVVPPGGNTPRSWADDDRLNDVLILGTFSQVILLIEQFAELAERLPQGNMPKEKSIPAMWEKVKDLKPASIERLEKAIQDLKKALANKDDRPIVDSKRGKEEATGGSMNPKSDKEECEMEEIDSEGVKARKTNSFFERHNMRNDSLNEEGSSIFHRASHVQIDYMCLLPLLYFTNIVHARLFCRTILPPFFLVLLPAHVSCLVAIRMIPC